MIFEGIQAWLNIFSCELSYYVDLNLGYRWRNIQFLAEP